MSTICNSKIYETTKMSISSGLVLRSKIKFHATVKKNEAGSGHVYEMMLCE